MNLKIRNALLFLVLNVACSGLAAPVLGAAVSKEPNMNFVPEMVQTVSKDNAYALSNKYKNDSVGGESASFAEAGESGEEGGTCENTVVHPASSPLKLLFTHTDLDGYGCRILFEIANKNRHYKVIHTKPYLIDKVVRSTLDELLSSGVVIEEIIFTDICPQMSTISELKNDGYSLKVIDHHITNANTNVFPDLCIVSEVGGVKQSSTSLLYDAMLKKNELTHNSLINEFVDAVRSYDTYEWRKGGNLKAKKLKTLYDMMGRERFCKHYTARLSDPSAKTLIDPHFEELIDAKLELQDKALAAFSGRDVHRLNVAVYKVALILNTKNCNISDIAEEFLPKYPEYDAVVALSFGNGSAGYSLRSNRDDVDLAKIAEALGSGGHPKAAGAGMSSEALLQIIRIIEDDLNRAEIKRDK